MISGDVTETSVGSNHHSYSGMFTYHFLCSDAGSFCKRDRFIEPGGHDHTFNSVFLVTGCALNHKADAVNASYLDFHLIIYRNFHCRFRNKFWLRSHNGCACTALRQYIFGLLTAMYIVNPRNNHHIHEPFNKCRFSSSYRTYNTEVDLAAGSCLDIFIQMKLVHKKPPHIYCYKYMRRGFI